MRPRDRDQVDHRVGRAADRGQRLDRVLERLAREDLRELQVLVHHLDDAPARHCARSRCGGRRPPDRRRCPAGRGRAPRPCWPSSTPCPSSCSGRGCGACSFRLRRSPAACSVPARTCSLMLHTPVPEPSSWPRHLPLSIGPPETPIVGRSHARRAHHQRRRGLVAAHQQHDAVDRVAADRFLDVHAARLRYSIAVGPQQRLAERHHRELEREAAGFVDADLDLLGQRAEVRVARRQLAERVADADHRAGRRTGRAARPCP